jgi:hypothetical protein
MLYLLRHGVPWEVMRGWSRARRMAACVAIAEQQGAVFDWDAMRYRAE